MSYTAAAASTQKADEVTATTGTFDPDVANTASGASQQLQRALQYQQYQRQLAKQQQQFQQWRQGKFGQAMARSEPDRDVSASAFDPEPTSAAGAKPPVIREKRKISIYFQPLRDEQP